MTFPDGLERRYKVLSSNTNKLRLHKKITVVLTIILIGAMVGLTPISSTVLKTPTINFAYVFIGIFMAIFVGIFVLMARSNKYILEKDDLTFFRFYDAYLKSLTYVDAKSDQTKKEAQDSIRRLVSHIDSWIENSPSQLMTLPISINKKIQEKIISLIEEDNKDAISRFTNHLFNFVLALSNNSITQALINLDANLGNLEEPRKSKISEEKEGLFHQYPYLKFVCLGILAGTLLYSALSFTDAVPSQAIGFSVATGVGITMGLPNLIKYKK